MEFILFQVRVKRYDSDKEKTLYFHSQRELKKAIMPIEKRYVSIWQLCQFVCNRTCKVALTKPPTEVLFQETNEIVKEIRSEYDFERDARNGALDIDFGCDELFQEIDGNEIDPVVKQGESDTYVDEELDSLFNYD